MTPKQYLEKYSGKIVSVGDTFDYYRSSIEGETQWEYLNRTYQYWKHIRIFVRGNHDSYFLRENCPSFEIYREKNVIAFHGHQVWVDFDEVKLKLLESKWITNNPKKSLFWDIEEAILLFLNKRFQLNKKQSYIQAFNTLSCLNKHKLLSEEIDTVITGHTHLPFDVKINYRDKEYRVINLGSTLKGKPFNPVYIESVDKLFISDLHLGTNKSIFN